MSTGLFLVRRDSTWMHAADLFVTADDGVDLAVAGARREVLAVLLQRLELVFRVLRRHAVRAAHLGQRPEQFLAVDAEAVAHREQKVLDGQEVVAEICLDALRVVEDGVDLAAEAWFVATVRLGQLGHGGVGAVADHQRRLTELRQHGRHDRVVLARIAARTWSGVSSGLEFDFALSTAAPRAS